MPAQVADDADTVESIKLTTYMDDESIYKLCRMQQGEGYVSLHAYSTHMMPGAPPPFDMPLEDGPLTPDMPDEELPVVSTAQMSESFSQVSDAQLMAHSPVAQGLLAEKLSFGPHTHWPPTALFTQVPSPEGLHLSRPL